MKLRIWATGLVSALAALATESGMELYQKAVTQERAGKMDEAIKLYEKVAHDFASDRGLAAKALVAAAKDYEKLGEDNAVKLYERVARDYGDQREFAATANARLAALRQAASRLGRAADQQPGREPQANGLQTQAGRLVRLLRAFEGSLDGLAASSSKERSAVPPTRGYWRTSSPSQRQLYDPASRVLPYANAGHCAPMLVREGNCLRLKSLTAPAGMWPALEAEERTVQLASGDWLLVFSDGIPEAVNEHGEEFGDDRLLAALGRLGGSKRRTVL